MRSSKVRGGIVLLAAAVLALAVAGGAFAASVHTVTTRAIVALDSSLSITAESTGDAGGIHGNLNYWTSPVDSSGNFYWFNKSVQITDFSMPDLGNGVPTFGGATTALNTGSGYGAPTALPAPYIVSADGVYSVAATGTDTGGDRSGEITPAFGIDQTDPVVTSDRVPFYKGAPVVTVTATDTMSGVENVLFNVDGVHNDSWEPDVLNPSSFTVGFPFATEGLHTLSWTAFDNAGNTVHETQTLVVDNTAPTTTSDMVALYNGAAHIHLSATDNLGGSGVAHTYYILDGQPQQEGTTINVSAPVNGSVLHTLEFWSVDAVGNIETPHVTGSFTVNSQHTITPSRSNTHGSITPSTAQIVNLGGSKKFTMKAAKNYKISKVLVDGKSIGAKTSYTFNNVTANHTIRVVFVHK